MSELSLDQLCESGQELLMETRYLEAEEALVRAESLALRVENWDALSRLYMPLQEARRQRRQRCGEGAVRLDLFARGPEAQPDPEQVLERYPHGQLLVAGWGAIEPALKVQSLAAERGLYVETFLGCVYPIAAARAIVIVPLKQAALPAPKAHSIDDLRSQLPPHCIVLTEDELPRGERLGTYKTYAHIMSLWERLHAPFLAAADAEPNPRGKIDVYRKTIQVDYACELAHQKLADVAKHFARQALNT